MIWLILGVALWTAAHLFKRVMPEARAKLGDPGKGIMAVAILVSVVLMVLGYRSADGAEFWARNEMMVRLNNLLVLFAFYLYAASGMKTGITRVIRHPQLTAVKIWAVAHLLVNGDLASIILFGGMLAWAVVSVIVLNRSAVAWVKNPPVPVAKEIMAVVGAVVVTGVVMGIHNWLGYQPWG